MIKPDKQLLLKDIGEFNLLKKHIIPTLKFSKEIIGDDCAFLNTPKNIKQLIVTTDAGPKPLFHSKKSPYYFIWGWYTVLANISDLASAGCYPLGISLAIEASPEMAVSDLRDFFKGVNAAAETFKTPVSGGNIKANTKFIANATAFGYIKKNQKSLTRRNCKPGDILISIGENGKFVTSFLKYRNNGYKSLKNDEKKKLNGPHPQLLAMQTLNTNKINITASSDNSDGILGSLWNIAESSNCGFQLDLDSIQIPSYILSYSKQQNINPWNLFFFWGDWQIIITVRKASLKKLIELCRSDSIEYTILGTAIKTKALYANYGNKRRRLRLLRNENFSKSSYNNGIKEHIDYLLTENIFLD